MTLPGLAIASVSPSTSTLCPSSRSASVVHPALLLSPRYAELIRATSAAASAVVAGRVIKLTDGIISRARKPPRGSCPSGGLPKDIARFCLANHRVGIGLAQETFVHELAGRRGHGLRVAFVRVIALLERGTWIAACETLRLGPHEGNESPDGRCELAHLALEHARR